MEGSEERAEVAARTGGWGGHVRYDPPIDYRELRSFADQELLQQVLEVYGEQAMRSVSGPGRGQVSLGCPRGRGRSRPGRRTNGRSGTLAPVAEQLGIYCHIVSICGVPRSLASAVMIAHRDTAQPHVHVVVNRVSVEDEWAAKLGNSSLGLSLS